MDRINHASANQGRFVAKDPNIEGSSGTVLTADWFNNIQDELINLISKSGLTPNRSDLEQVYKAIIKLRDGSYSELQLKKLVESVGLVFDKNNDTLLEDAQRKMIEKNSFGFSYMKVLPTPVTLAGTGKINGYAVDKATYDTDTTVALPAAEWDSVQCAYVRSGNPELYANFNYANDLARIVNNAPTFFDIPDPTSLLAPTLDFGNMNGVKLNSSTNISSNKRLFLILKISVGNSYSPHSIRRSFVDVSVFMYGQGAYTSPQLAAKNIAVDGYSFGNAYISTALIPLQKNQRRIDGIRLINNGVIDVRIGAYGFIYLDENCLK